MQLVIDTKGTELSKRNQCFFITDGKNKRIINPQRIHAITVTTHGKISTSAIRLAAENDIPIYILGTYGKLEARVERGSYGSNTTLRRSQVAFRETPHAIKWVKELLTHKTNQQLKTLNALTKLYKLPKATQEEDTARIMGYLETIQALEADNLNDISGTIRALEGNIARVYWRAIKEYLPPEWEFTGRKHQDATDSFNTLLNYTYGMLYTNIETAIFTAGLDPAFGIWHADTYGKPALAFDLIEPFRAMVDRWLLQAIAAKDLQPETDVLSKKQRQWLIKNYHGFLYSRLTFQESTTTFRNHLYRFAGGLTKIINSVAKLDN